MKQLDRRKEKLLQDFEKSKKVKKSKDGDFSFELGNVFVSVSKIEDILRNGNYGTNQNAIPLNGGYSLKKEQNKLIETYADDVRTVIMNSYKEEEVIKVDGSIKFNDDGLASTEIKKGDKTYIMRILDVTKDEQFDHYKWLTNFDKNEQPKKHLLPLYIYQSWNVEAKVATFKKTDKMDEFKLEFEDNFIEPKANGEQKHVIYLQEKCKGMDLRTWMEKKYYAFKQNNNAEAIIDEKNRKTITLFLKDFELTSNTDEGNKAVNMKIVQGVFEAIKEFHTITPGFAHRDVKLENFCMDGDKIYLIDFDNVLDVRDNTINKWNKTATIPMKNGKVYEDDKKIHNSNDNGIPASASVTKLKKDGLILMDRYDAKGRMQALLKANALAADLHQGGMAMLQLGGVFDWTSEYNYNNDKDRYSNMRSSVFTQLSTNEDFKKAVDQLHIIDFWRSLWEGYQKLLGKPSIFGKQRIADKIKNARVFIETLRKTKTNTYMAFNLHYSVVNEIAKKFFKTDKELVDKGFKEAKIVEAIKPINLQSPVITSPTQFMSTQRQPVFEKVSLESDFDDEDLQALMDFDPDVAELSDTSSPTSHISDAEFERMLHEDDNYDMLTEHIVKQNKAYNKKEIEEDARSIGSSNHSSASALSVASQISNASNASNASNISNLSASSEKSNVSNMSNHSYMSNNSLESEEHYPTSEQSYHMSEVSYNQTSDNSYNSGTDSSSGKDMDYSHGISESSDHESSNESLGYSSSGNSAQNHSYNSSSDTE